MAKYFWGDAPFSMPFMFVCLIVDAFVIGGVLIMLGPQGTVDEFPNAKDLRGVAIVNVFYALGSYILLGHQIGIKFGGEDLSADERTAASKIAERGVYNNIEQSIPFLILLWLHALFVNPRTSVTLGWIYLASRYAYPITFGMYGQFNSLVEVPQQITYAINFYLIYAVTYKCHTGSDLHTTVNDISPLLMCAVTLVATMTCTVVYLVLGKPGATVIMNGVQWDTTYKPPLASDSASDSE
mmetsp:Transcript_28609/g.62512  ORF Transcript_28609/g.62512 Transcript_28609/m.62512 type:complete len:240 (-) Transcript_28609:13-732(-)